MKKPCLGDLGPKGITKKYAVETLLDYLGMDAKDAIAFGDAQIDLSMFECCGYSVAMGNASEPVKQAADYVTDDVDADGLLHAFEHLGLNSMGRMDYRLQGPWH